MGVQTIQVQLLMRRAPAWLAPFSKYTRLCAPWKLHDVEIASREVGVRIEGGDQHPPGGAGAVHVPEQLLRIRFEKEGAFRRGRCRIVVGDEGGAVDEGFAGGQTAAKPRSQEGEIVLGRNEANDCVSAFGRAPIGNNVVIG